MSDEPPQMRDGLPAFVDVYDRLRGLIARDALEPGEMLPTEVVMAGELSVPRDLVREALLLLEEDRYLDRDSEWRWRVAVPPQPASFSAPFPELLGGGIRAERRLHAALESGSSWSRELLGSEEKFLVWETLFSHRNALLVSTLEVMLESSVPEGVLDLDWLDVQGRPTLLGCVAEERRAAMGLDLWRLTPLSRNAERLSWMSLPMHGIAAGLTVVLSEAGTPTYLAKNVFDLGTFGLSLHR